MRPSDPKKLQVEGKLRERFFPIIPELPGRMTPEQHDKNRLSRSLAAFAISKLANLEEAEAANAVIDGMDDNGIDAIYFDRAASTLYAGQSKAGSAPDLGENKKFCDGIRDLVHSRFHKFNEAFERLQPDVEEALATYGVKICGFIVFLEGELGAHAQAELESLKLELNHYQERFDFTVCGVNATHRWLADEAAIQPINLHLTLRNWNGSTAQRRLYYGLVDAGELADIYELHGRALFEKNIRQYLGVQAVNEGIKATVSNRPDELVILNNGVTAVCSTITLPPGGTNLEAAFHLTNFSIVNGAQTVGAIAAVKAQEGIVPAQAQIHMTIIELATEEGLGPTITRCRNTQNAIRSLYFVALDPNQERLRRELAISGITYRYRPSVESAFDDDLNMEAERAVLALAALSGSTEAIVAAKREISSVFDQSGPFYPSLVTDRLTGARLARYTRVYSYLDGIMAASESAEVDFFRRAFYRHGRLFTMHILARGHRDLLDRPEMELTALDKEELSRILTDLAEDIYAIAEAMFHRNKGYLSIFRNIGDARHLAQAVTRALAARNPGTQGGAI